MEKIQRLWEDGEIDQLVELIVSETDLSNEEAKRVIEFFEKYEDREYDEDYYDETIQNMTTENMTQQAIQNMTIENMMRLLDDDYSEYDYREYDFEEYDHPESHHTDDEQILKLEQRIADLEEENRMLHGQLKN